MPSASAARSTRLMLGAWTVSGSSAFTAMRLPNDRVEIDVRGLGDRLEFVPVDRDGIDVVHGLGLARARIGQARAHQKMHQRVRHLILVRVPVVEGDGVAAGPA